MNRILILLTIFYVVSCTSDDSNKADLIIHNAEVYTVNKEQPTASFVAIKDGKIIAVDSGSHRLYLTDDTELIDAEGHFVMPGWIEGHGHFSALGSSLQNLNFLNARSWEEIVSLVGDKAKHVPAGSWIRGGGWHQEKWEASSEITFSGYPTHEKLSAVTPDHPVILFHASGHSLFANKEAMKIAGISKETPDPPGGLIRRDQNGNPIGVFEERAMSLIADSYNSYIDGLDQEKVKKIWREGVELAQKECLRHGITSFQDAGSKWHELEAYEEMARNGDLDVRLWVMARHRAEELKGKVGEYKKIGIGNNFYTCNAIKSEVDGALGAYGAWLLQPYTDKPGFSGQNTTPISEVKDIAELALEHDMQLCVHAIGDRANRIVVDIFEGMLDQVADGKSRRWRVEHAQHIDPIDIPRFASNGIIASMQGIHCTSDAPFVVKRLGESRAKNGAYAWRSFLDKDVLVSNGTDAPVENVNPIPSFYASVTRKRIDTGMEFFPEQAMTRAEALYSYTLGNAYAAFEEDIKGSLEVGKVADIAIMSENLVDCSDDAILNTEVLYTIVNGVVKYSKTQ